MKSFKPALFMFLLFGCHKPQEDVKRAAEHWGEMSSSQYKGVSCMETDVCVDQVACTIFYKGGEMKQVWCDKEGCR